MNHSDRGRKPLTNCSRVYTRVSVTHYSLPVPGLTPQVTVAMQSREHHPPPILLTLTLPATSMFGLVIQDNFSCRALEKGFSVIMEILVLVCVMHVLINVLENIRLSPATPAPVITPIPVPVSVIVSAPSGVSVSAVTSVISSIASVSTVSSVVMTPPSSIVELLVHLILIILDCKLHILELLLLIVTIHVEVITIGSLITSIAVTSPTSLVVTSSVVPNRRLALEIVELYSTNWSRR